MRCSLSESSYCILISLEILMTNFITINLVYTFFLVVLFIVEWIPLPPLAINYKIICKL